MCYKKSVSFILGLLSLWTFYLLGELRVIGVSVKVATKIGPLKIYFPFSVTNIIHLKISSRLFRGIPDSARIFQYLTDTIPVR